MDKKPFQRTRQRFTHHCKKHGWTEATLYKYADRKVTVCDSCARERKNKRGKTVRDNNRIKGKDINALAEVATKEKKWSKDNTKAKEKIKSRQIQNEYDRNYRNKNKEE